MSFELIRTYVAPPLVEVFEAGDLPLNLNSYDEVRSVLISILTERIAALLSNNPEKLMALLYRIDVSERDVAGIFESASTADLAMALAELVVERQTRKAETRRNHRRESST